MNKSWMTTVFVAAAAFGIILSTGAVVRSQEKMMKMPFGTKTDVAFAKQLWAALKSYRLVGPDRINVEPFEGNEPHGAIQQVLSRPLKVGKRTGKVIVKVNHGGKDVDVDEVYQNPNKHIGAYTVMYKKPAGYDPENQDWFWVKYSPKGEIMKNPKGMMLAGRVAKGMAKGCIACHSKTGGADLEVLTRTK